MKNYKRPSNVNSSQVALFVFKAHQSFYAGIWKSNSIKFDQEVHNKLEMILKQLGRYLVHI